LPVIRCCAVSDTVPEKHARAAGGNKALIIFCGEYALAVFSWCGNVMKRICGTVERLWEERRHVDDDEILVHEFGSTPIVTRNPYSSMRLAMYCHENVPPNGLRWIKASPTDVDAAIESASKRQTNEALCARGAQH
jgi:hypothetical protein